ncbi:hypothetical protein OA100_00795 [Alphaproteobacteria bacterium]|nr:hypothetical protein [Alphaproteobacteria bacterium]
MSKKIYDANMNIESYIRLINFFKKKKYKFKFFSDNYEKKGVVYLRHDVDLLTEDALKLAELENKIKVKATYFFLVNTDTYNIYSDKNKLLIKKIINFGHDIGLHYDGSFNNIEKEAKLQILILEKIINRTVHFISFHKPLKKILNLNKKVCNKKHTYMSKYFSDIMYCSDSRGRWKFGLPTEKKGILEKKSIQLLTHPEWWVAFKNEKNSIYKNLKRIKKTMLNSNKTNMESALTNYNYNLNKFLDNS